MVTFRNLVYSFHTVCIKYYWNKNQMVTLVELEVWCTQERGLNLFKPVQVSLLEFDKYSFKQLDWCFTTCESGVFASSVVPLCFRPNCSVLELVDTAIARTVAKNAIFFKAWYCSVSCNGHILGHCIGSVRLGVKTTDFTNKRKFCTEF